jgi:hypothetical protein
MEKVQKNSVNSVLHPVFILLDFTTVVFFQFKVVSLESNFQTWRTRSLYLCPPVTVICYPFVSDVVLGISSLTFEMWKMNLDPYDLTDVHVKFGVRGSVVG